MTPMRRPAATQKATEGMAASPNSQPEHRLEGRGLGEPRTMATMKVAVMT